MNFRIETAEQSFSADKVPHSFQHLSDIVINAIHTRFCLIVLQCTYIKKECQCVIFLARTK